MVFIVVQSEKNEKYVAKITLFTHYFTLLNTILLIWGNSGLMCLYFGHSPPPSLPPTYISLLTFVFNKSLQLFDPENNRRTAITCRMSKFCTI